MSGYEKTLAWREDNPARQRELTRVHNARRAAKGYGVEDTLTAAEWYEILEEYDYRCAYCLKPYEQLEHIVSLSEGGANAKDNVVPACRRCNHGKLWPKTGWVPSIASRFWPRLAEELYA